MRQFSIKSSATGYFSGEAGSGWRIILLLLIGVAILVGTVSAACPTGYECMTDIDALNLWGAGNYERYSSTSCGGGEFGNLYCYRKIPPAVSVACPTGYECTTEANALSRWGAGNYKRYSSASCGVGEFASAYYCYQQIQKINAAPVASFMLTQNQNTAPSYVTFDASASSDSDGISYYEWTVSGPQGAINAGGPWRKYEPIMVLVYPTPGTYTVTLRVGDKGSPALTATTTRQFTVTPPPE